MNMPGSLSRWAGWRSSRSAHSTPNRSAQKGQAGARERFRPRVKGVEDDGRGRAKTWVAFKALQDDRGDVIWHTR